MLKSLVLFSILLYSITCRSVEKEDSCQDESKKKFQSCLDQFMNNINETRDAVTKMMETSSTVSPIEFDIRKEYKNMLKCIGNMECKGPIKLIKYQLDIMDFYGDQAWEAKDCLEIDQSSALNHCMAPKDFKPTDNFSQSVVPCMKEVIEKTECSIQIKVNLERAAYAVSDMYAHMEKSLNDKNYSNNFDLVFDPRKYGL